MTKIRNYFIIFFLAACIPAAAQRYTISPINADLVLNQEKIQANVEYLCSEELGGRATGTEGGRNTAAWLEGEFRILGLKPLGGAWLHGFSTNDGLARNVVGLIPGSATPARYMVLMAHFDNLGTLNGRFYPGADANASGVAALLQVTEMINQMNTCRKIYRHGLIVVALDAKDDLVINLDQLGSTQAPITEGNGRYLMMLSDESTGRRSSLESANREPGFGFELGYDYYGSKDFTRLFFRRISDQRVFLDHGIPAVMFTSGITLLNNKPTDTPASLDYGILRDRVRLIFRYLDKVL